MQPSKCARTPSSIANCVNPIHLRSSLSLHPVFLARDRVKGRIGTLHSVQVLSLHPADKTLQGGAARAAVSVDGGFLPSGGRSNIREPTTIASTIGKDMQFQTSGANLGCTSGCVNVDAEPSLRHTLAHDVGDSCEIVP